MVINVGCVRAARRRDRRAGPCVARQRSRWRRLVPPMTRSAEAGTRPTGGPERPKPKQPKPPTRLVLVRHAVTAHTGPMLSGRMPGIDLSEKGVGPGRSDRATPREAADRRRLREPDRTHDADRAAHRRAPPISMCEPLPRRDRGRLRRLDRAARSRISPRPTSGKSCRSRRRARSFPNGESSARHAGAHGRDARRGRRGHPHETVVVVSHADPIKSAIAHYTGHAPRPVPTPPCVAGVGDRLRLPRVRRDDGEVQRHRRPRRSRARAASADETAPDRTASRGSDG